MRHHNNKRRFLVPAIVLAVCCFLVAAMTLVPAMAAEKNMKCAEPSQAQQMCPPQSTTVTCGASTCTVSVDCPAIKSPGKTVCQATIDCPAKPAKPAKEKKSK
jgi:hypothetical protein